MRAKERNNLQLLAASFLNRIVDCQRICIFAPPMNKLKNRSQIGHREFYNEMQMYGNK